MRHIVSVISVSIKRWNINRNFSTSCWLISSSSLISLILPKIKSFSSLIFFSKLAFFIGNIDRSFGHLCFLVYSKISKNKIIFSYLFLKLIADCIWLNFSDHLQSFSTETFVILIKFELLCFIFTKPATPCWLFILQIETPW